MDAAGAAGGSAEAEGRSLVLTASVLALLVGSGAMFLVVVALKPIAEEFGWPRAVPSLAFSLQFVGSGLGGMAMGWALDRYGMGLPALAAALMIGSGAVLMGEVDAAWQLYSIYGVMFGFFGLGALAAPSMANIARWYVRRRGMAVGMVAGGQALAGILWPPIFGYAMQLYGWRQTALLYGLFALAALLPLCLVLRRRAPAPARRPAARSGSAPGPAPPRAAMPARRLQLALCAAIVGCCVAMALPLGHLVSYVTDLGHPIEDAVEILSVLLMSAFFTRAVLVGLFSDTIGGLPALLVFSGTQAAALAAFTAVDGLYALHAVAVCFGLGYGGIFPVYAVAIREHMPFAEAGRRTGTVFLFGALAMGFGSWIGGALFDATGSYVPAFLLGVGFNAANVVLVALLVLRLRAARRAGPGT